MTSVLYRTFLVAVCIKQGKLQSNIVLSLSKEIIPENTSATLTCSKTTGSLDSVRWITSMEENGATCGLLGGTCHKFNFLTNNDLYDCICNGGTISVLLKNVDRYQHGATWRCEDIQETVSNTVVISVSVPVTHTTVLKESSNSPIYENATAKFACNTSYSLPPALIRWYRSNESSTVEIRNNTDRSVHLERESFKRDDNLISVVETLSFRVSRSIHGWNIYCNESSVNSNLVMSNKISLSVTYGASVKKFLIRGHENENPVIANESSRIEFICEMDSNPVATVAINSPNGTILLLSSKNIIEYNLLLTSCMDSGIYSCLGSNDYNNGKYTSAYMRILVNCKPMAYSPVQEYVRSELYVPVTLQFKAVAYPEPKFTWEMWTTSSWEQLTSNRITSISSVGMQSKLTVKNFASMEVNFFRLIVENFVGNLIQNYTVQPFAMETSTERSKIPVGLVAGSIIGVVAIAVGIVLTCTLCLYRKRTSGRRDRKCKSTNNVKSNEEVFEMTTIADSITDGRLPPTQQTVYEDIIPHTDRGIIERMENAYEQLRPNEGTVSEEVERCIEELKEENDDIGSPIPAYTNLKL